jgi:hypothetical protein
MSVNLSALAGAGQQFFDNNGVILSGGKLYSYAAGTTTPQAAYTSASGSTPHTNPIILNSAGRVATGEIWLTAGENYKFSLFTSTDVLIATWDNITGINGTGITTDAAAVALTPSGYTTATTVQAGFDDLGSSAGTSKVGFIQAGTGAVSRAAQAKLRESVSVKDFGAVGDGVTDDTAAIQAAATATPNAGRLYFPRGKYKLSDEILLTRPILIVGDGPGQTFEGYDTADTGSYIVQTNTTKMGFKLVAALANYAFSAYGICGIHFQDICVQGVDTSNRIVACVGVDTTVNAGDFHIRGNSTTRCSFRYATSAIDFTGIAYLNNFYQTNFSFSGTGVLVAKGAASDSGGQTRFFGCLFEFCTNGASLNYASANGTFSFFGCTFGGNLQNGIITNDEVDLVCVGNHFESNLNTGIYVLTPLAKANSNSTHFRHICGNAFGDNTVASIWFDKLATSSSDGNFSYPTRIDSNSFIDVLAVKLSVPSGDPGFASTNFVIGASNTGTNNGQLDASQVSATFFGTDERRRSYSKRFVFGAGSYVSGDVIDMLPIGLVVESARIYLTANSTSYTNFILGDIADSDRYIAVLNANADPLNTWVSWTPTVPQVVINGSNNQFRLIGSGGIDGAAGVVEITGYVQ